MRVAVEGPNPAREPHLRVNHEQVLAMLLRPGVVEMGCRRSELRRFTYDAGEMILASRHVETWARTDSVHYLSLAISDAALTAACDGMAGEIELRGTPKFVDAHDLHDDLSSYQPEQHQGAFAQPAQVRIRPRRPRRTGRRIAQRPSIDSAKVHERGSTGT